MKYYNLSLRNLVYRLRKFKGILDEELKNAILEYEKEITGLVRSQLWQGKDGYGYSIEPLYTRFTKSTKLRKGQVADRVTLRDTGKFYKSFFIETYYEGFSIESYDRKADALLEKYGESVLRLSNENLSITLSEYIRPYLQKKIKEKLLQG